MACFVVPAVEAVATTIAAKVIEKSENKELMIAEEKGISIPETHREKLSVRLKRLNGLLWGGSVLLAFEHLWHGEIQPFFPFLTAAGDPAAMTEVVHEMMTVGVGMAALVTVAWGVVTTAVDIQNKKRDSVSEATQTE